VRKTISLTRITIVALLAKALAEEENADPMLNRVARSSMSIEKMLLPATIEQTALESDTERLAYISQPLFST
jgi:Mn-containing catalase